MVVRNGDYVDWIFFKMKNVLLGGREYFWRTLNMTNLVCGNLENQRTHAGTRTKRGAL